METVRMRAPEGATSCSHNGIVYDVVDGFVHVLHMAVEALHSFGYHIDSDPAVETEKLAKADAAAQAAADETAAALKAHQEELDKAIEGAADAVAHDKMSIDQCVKVICEHLPLANADAVKGEIQAKAEAIIEDERKAREADAAREAEAKRVADEAAAAETGGKKKGKSE